MDETLVAQGVQYGLPSVLLLAASAAGWKSLVWFGANILIPMRDRHFAFLTKVEESLERIELALKK